MKQKSIVDLPSMSSFLYRLNNSETPRFVLGVLGFGFLPALSSAWLFQKYFGVQGALTYIGLSLLTICGLCRLAVKLTRYQAYLAALFVWGLCLVIFLVVYPRITYGSDRDEALNVAIYALFTGQYPYYKTTHLGNPLSPLPGSFFLAAPFYLLTGNSAYQNLAWLAVYFLLLRVLSGDPITSFLMFTTTLFVYPTSLHEIMIGGDLFTASVAALLVAVAVYYANRYAWQETGYVLLGAFSALLLSTRFNFYLIAIAVLLPHIIASRGLKAGILYAGSLAFFSAILILPFLLFDIQRFTPLNNWRTFDTISNIIPHLGKATVLFTICVGILLALRSTNVHGVLAACAFVQFLPLCVSALVASIALHRFDFSPFYRGHIFVYFWLAGPGILLLHRFTKLIPKRRGAG